MDLQDFRFEIDPDGVALLTWDMPGRSMNLITPCAMDALEAVIERVSTDAMIRGCIVTSGKETFSGGADLSMLPALAAEVARVAAVSDDEATASEAVRGGTPCRLDRPQRIASPG